jgi:hypothetical protein
MNTTYVASTNAVGDAQTLGDAGRDIYVRKVVFGNPTDGAVTNFYNKRVAPGHASGMASVSTTDCVLQVTQPTAAAGKDWVREIDFGVAPLQLDGGSFHTNENDVTVIWEYVDEAV